MFWIDYYYIILVLPAVIFAMVAQARVSSTFRKYSQVISRSGITGKEMAELVLHQNGVTGVSIERVSGELTDHYDPRQNVIRLSDSVYGNPSIAAAGVAAHEAGHAVQYAKRYHPIQLRAALIPVCNLGSTLSMPLVIAGLILSWEPLAMVGVLLFGLAMLFQLVTLPVEFNASRRAIAAMTSSGMFHAEETQQGKKVLQAAAMTYVAALAVSLMNFLRLLLLVRGGGRRK